MTRGSKNTQLQIRVSVNEKAAIQRAARHAGLDMSSYVLSRVLSPPARKFQECVIAASGEASPSFALAELNSLLTELSPGELGDAIETPPSAALTPFVANYIAAMVEHGCARCSISPPAWTLSVKPLTDPVFGTTLLSLRLYLLTRSPVCFRRRNIFIDTTLGGRV